MPAECDGISLVPVLTGKKEKVRDTLFAVYTGTQRMVRDERWKLLWFPKLGKFQLFDLKTDPDELTNLADGKSGWPSPTVLTLTRGELKVESGTSNLRHWLETTLSQLQ